MLTLNNANFEQLVLQEKEKTVMVEFWAPWCTYCKRIAAAFDALAEEYSEELVIGKVNIDEAMELAERYQVLLIPTVMIFKNGEAVGRIVNPPTKASIEALIASKTKKQQIADATVYDTIIIGGGPGGYAAALYCTRAGLNTLVLEKVSAGGQIAQSTAVDNYPGFEEGIDGFELGQKMQQQAERFGARTELLEVMSVELSGPIKVINTSEGELKARTVVVATGANPRKLGHPREEELLGRGVHYCAACDGMFYKGKTAVVVGGGNTAIADTLLLSRVCEKVYVVHRRDTLRGEKIYQKTLFNTPNVEFIWDSAVQDILGKDRVEGVVVNNLKTGAVQTLACQAIFVSVGRIPAADMFYGILDRDEAGYIKADESTRTNLPGVFAVGDVRTKALRQVVTAVADGAMASHYIEEYLAEQA